MKSEQTLMKKINWALKPNWVFWDLLKETLQRDQYSTGSLCISIDAEKEISSSFMLIVWIQTVWSAVEGFLLTVT